MSVKESKPNLSCSQVSEFVKQVFGFTVAQIQPLPSYDDQNFYIVVDNGAEYVLKVMNSADSENLAVLEIQTQAMKYLHMKGLPAQTAIPTNTGQLMCLQEFDCGFGRKKYLVRLLTFLPGTTIAKVSCSPQLLYEVGKMAATIDKVLKEMEHLNLELLQRENFIWSLSSIPLLEQYIPVLNEDPVQLVVKAVMEQYKTKVKPKLSFFRKCINHGDFNDHNILVESNNSSGYTISGILDFADMSSGFFVFELAITIMYMMIENPSPLDVGGPVLAGFESVIPLNEQERDALYLLVLCRFCQSLVLARYAVILQPENEQYLMTTARKGVQHLWQLWKLGKEEVERKWFQSASLYSSKK